MSDDISLFDNPDSRPESVYETDLSLREDREKSLEMWVNEEAERSSLLKTGPMSATPSEFITGAIKIPVKGKLANFSFKGREYLRTIYDSPAKRKLLIAGRQVEKSTMLGNLCLAHLLINPYFRVLYVSPSNQQTKVFSRDRIAEPIELSQFLQQTTNSRLLKNVFEKRFVNHSQLTMRFAFLNADRCISGNSRVQLTDGRVVAIRDLVGLSPVGLVAANVSGAPTRSMGACARSMGVKDVVKVATSFPIPLVCTPDHRILTGRGWVNAGDLREGDYVAAPHPVALLKEEPIGADMAWILGALISEGESVSKKCLRFTNTDEDFLLEFEERARALGVNCGERVIDDRYDKVCYTVSLYSSRGPGIDGVKADIWNLGEFGQRASRKHIPTCIFKAPIVEKSSFLRALFRGDGWRCPESGFGRAGYSTASEQLADDLVLLLWGLGIRSHMRWRGPSTKNASGSFTIDFSTEDTAKLVTLTGAYRPGLDYREVAGKSIKDRIPFSYMRLREYLAKEYGLSTHAAWTNHRIQLRPGNRKDAIGRRVLRDISKKLNDPYLATLSDPSTSWVEVESVESAGREEVFDLTVEGPECFQANGLIVHNCRGIPADKIVIDEFQDILLDNVPVIEECASHSDFKYYVYAGTPKSLDNSIEYYWSRFSTQNEWTVPCRRHGTPKDPGTWHWNVLDEENIGETGLICNLCRKPIRADDPDAQWVALNPKPNVKQPFEGYRIPQIMVPWISWAQLKDKQRVYSRAKFHNEVLGRSYDSGTRPLTRRDVQKNCWGELSMQFYKDVIPYHTQYPIFMGIDWGTGEGSYTVVCLGGYLPFAPDRFTWFYWRRFEGADSEPRKQIEIIRRLINDFGVQKIGVDYGGGHWPNDELTRDYGVDKIKKYQWVGNVKKKIKFDPLLGVPRHLCHRTEVMSDMFNAIKRGDVFWFPRWEEFEEPFASDMLNIYSEFNDRLRMNVYKASPGHPDDSFHAMTFGFLASFYHRPRPDVILPTKEIQREHGLVGSPTEDEGEDDMDDLDVT
jgi:intein/homing endonuclease